MMESQAEAVGGLGVGYFLFKCRGWRRRGARFSGAGGGLTKRGLGRWPTSKKGGKRVTRQPS